MKATVESMRALIFDFDGLLVDTEGPAYSAWSAIYREHGAELALERWVECVGSNHSGFDPCDHLAALLGKQVDRQALFADKEQRKATICLSQPLMAGAERLLSEARGRGLKIAVASSSEGHWVYGHLERLGLRDKLDVVRTRDDVTRVKPDPELYLSAAGALAVTPSDCLVFEDSLNGVKAAKAAGMRCIAVPNAVTAGLDFSLADRRVTSLTEVRLVELIKELSSES